MMEGLFVRVGDSGVSDAFSVCVGVGMGVCRFVLDGVKDEVDDRFQADVVIGKE